MGTYREQDPLANLLMRQQTRVLECVERFANGDSAAALAEARHVLRALGDAETEVLYPAFSRVRLKPETQHLLDDSRGSRAEQLEALNVLAHKRVPRLRKLGAVAFCDRIRHHGMQHVSLLIPVLASQLPRALYRSIVTAFTTHYEQVLEAQLVTREPKRQRASISA